MKLRSVNTSFWSDPFIEELSPSEKLIYLYLITNEKTNMLGIYELSIKKMSFDTGINKETILKALKGFERVGKVKYRENFVILTKYLKHQSFNTNMKKSAIDCYNCLPESLKIQGVTVDKNNPLEGFESLLKGYGILSKIEVEVEVEVESKEEKEMSVDLPFKSKKFEMVWSDWKDYKSKDHGFKYKSEVSEKVALNQLIKIAPNENEAIKVIEQSIANGWKGFFAVKENVNEPPKQTFNKNRPT